MSPATANKTLDHVPEWMGPNIRIYSDPPIPYGAIASGIQFDPATVHAEDVVMQFCLYTTEHHVHGLLRMERTVEHPNHVEPQVYKYFFGYRCCECNEVYLVPDWVANETDLGRAMRHDCAGIKQNSGVKR